MNRILIVFTGGTISMTSDDHTNKSVIHENDVDLIDKIRKRFQDLDLLPHVFSMKPSPSMTPTDMFNLGKLIDEKMALPEFTGCVVTHGTDTLEETAYFLDLFLKTKKPVVLTGSMRNFSELGYDGFSNLLSAILVASEKTSYNRGVLVCLNDEINAASEVTKTHTLALDTFKSMEFGPLGIVDEQDVIYYRESTKRKSNIAPARLKANVEIIKVVTGQDSSLLYYYITTNKVQGIVLEAFGRGNVPPTMVDGIKRAIDKGIKIVLTSRCPKGRVRDSYGYDGGGYHLKQLGVLFSGDLSSQKARLKLMLALSLEDSAIEQYFDL
ncbi:MAG: asparaginase [Acholeplasma sp.]|jgi:L-asparaginase|nr:asparaginase [Acholeplasma sp.]